MTIRFGPAGLGPVKTAIDTLEGYQKSGLRACEIAFTYSTYIKPEQTQAIKEKAEELDIELTIHGSYFINLNSDEKEKVVASKKRILDACEIGELLGVKLLVFHPGYYGKNKSGAYKNIMDNIKDIMRIMKKNKLKIQLAPETMGKINVFGSVEEISQLVKDTGCNCCIDYAHILARDKEVDYKKVEKLFPQKDWHIHFSGIVYGEKGEKHHKTTTKDEWKTLLKNLPKDKTIRIANESPTHVQDAIDGMKIWKSMK
jgi:deoxyribonuclease IV